jgi:hypothetical protein
MNPPCAYSNLDRTHGKNQGRSGAGKRHGLRPKHGQGMRLEGDEDQFGLSLCGNVSRGFENPLMAEMHAVEISDGHYGLLGGF